MKAAGAPVYSTHVQQFEIGDLKNFVYLLKDPATKNSAIIDPQADLAPLLAQIKQEGSTLAAIFLTHTHFDHVAGVPELIRKFPELPIYVGALDRHRLENEEFSGGNYHHIKDGEVIQLGDLKIQVLHTPGHSRGECSFLVEHTPPLLFTGDTLFIRDCGRTDFADGSNSEMFASLQKIKALPKDTVIFPGHHYAPEFNSTLGREIETSPPLRCLSVEELAQLP